MPNNEGSKNRKRLVVEEVNVEASPKKEIKEEAVVPSTPKILDKAAKDEVIIEAATPTLNQPTTKKKSSSIALWIIIPGIFVLGAILGGVVFYQRGISTAQSETPTPVASSMPIATPTAMPTSSPSAVILSKYAISIYNGSGIPGEAGKAKSLLTTDGYTVGSTANAATYDYTKTLIKAKGVVDPAFVSSLSTALGKTYVVDTPQTLASSSADTVQVVIGSSKAQ